MKETKRVGIALAIIVVFFASYLALNTYGAANLDKFQERELELEKAIIIEESRTNPVIKGLIDGTMYFYIEPIPPYYKVPGINDVIDVLADDITGKYFGVIDIRRTYDKNSAGLTIGWIKNYGGHIIGESIFKSVIKVGMGEDNCMGDWQAFDIRTIKKIMWHEIGHSLGLSHSDDPEHIMYYLTKTQFYRDVEHSFELASRDKQWFLFCKSGAVSFHAESSRDTNGFDAFIIPPDSDPRSFTASKGKRYVDCGLGSVILISRNCNIASGSYLHFTNNQFRPIYITFEMYDKNPSHWPDMTLNPEFSTSKLNKILKMFR